MEFSFNTFKDYLRQVARDTKQILLEFQNVPEFDLWQNPIADRARAFKSLALGSRLRSTDLLFQASDASGLCCDGNEMLDARISNSRRLWLLYQYHSLTKFDGTDGYTRVFAMITATLNSTTTIHIGFDWFGGDNPSRLTFETAESKLQKSILNRKNWRALHKLEHPYGGIKVS